MRDLARTDRAGADLLGLLQAAERLGFSAHGVKSHDGALARAPLSVIASVRTDEGAGDFVVLHRVDRKRVVVADPAREVRMLDRAECHHRWTGDLLVLDPLPHQPRLQGAREAISSTTAIVMVDATLVVLKLQGAPSPRGAAGPASPGCAPERS